MYVGPLADPDIRRNDFLSTTFPDYLFTNLLFPRVPGLSQLGGRVRVRVNVATPLREAFQYILQFSTAISSLKGGSNSIVKLDGGAIAGFLLDPPLHRPAQ